MKPPSAPLGSGLFLACALAGGACQKANVEPQQPSAIDRQGNRLVIPPGSPLRERLKIDAVHLQSLRRHLVAPAVVEADPTHLAKITPPLVGRVVRLQVRFGDKVKQGQPLFALDSPDAVSAQTDYLKAKSALSQAERTLVRQKDLRAHGIGAQREVEQAQTDRDVAYGEFQRAELRLKLLKIDSGHLGEPLTVRSPIDGQVIELAVAPGEFKNDPNTVLMTVADLSTVWVTANVQERDIRRVHQGDEATAVFAAYPGEVFKGNVLSVASLLDPDTHAVKVRVSFPNADLRLKPGMFATMTFASVAASELVAPTSALVLIGDANYVFVELAPWAFERRKVETAEQQSDFTVIRSGIEEGTRIVVKDAVLLQ